MFIVLYFDFFVNKKADKGLFFLFSNQLFLKLPSPDNKLILPI